MLNILNYLMLSIVLQELMWCGGEVCSVSKESHGHDLRPPTEQFSRC